MKRTAPVWSRETTGTEVSTYFQDQIVGKHVLITGVSPKSIGATTAINIARHSPGRLILASRSKSKMQQVADEIATVSPKLRVDIVELDLASQTSVRRAATEIAALTDYLDVLICNAGVVTSDRRETAEGIELQFGANHVGHFLLTILVMPQLLASPKSRVINLSSLGHRLSPVRFHDYNFTGKAIPPGEEPPARLPSHLKPDVAAGRPYFSFTAYGQSRTANILHAVSLNERFSERGLRAFAVHPGSIWTDLSRNLTPEDLKAIEGTSTFWKDLDQGSASTLAAAFDPTLVYSKGNVLVSDCRIEGCAPYAADSEIADRLWKLSEALTTAEQGKGGAQL